MTESNITDVAPHKLCRSVRERLGITQAQLAEIMGVTETTIIRWEADPNTSPHAREMSPTAQRVLFWMLQPGRPAVWPRTTRAGWPIK